MNRICYIPMLEGQAEDVRTWMAGVRDRCGVVSVLLPPVDWNDDLTPWPAEPIFKKGKPFGGRAEVYLRRLETEIIPSIEAEMSIVPDERWIVGVSLAGLFALWAAVRSCIFQRIAAISASFWYPGFTVWLQGQALPASFLSAYVSLGDKESQGKNPHLNNIAAETAAVVRILEDKMLPVTFEWTEGTHFAPVVPRLEKAMQALRREKQA